MNRSSDTSTSVRSADREEYGVPVFCADPAGVAEVSVEVLPEGFDGRLSLRGAENLGYEETVSALQRLGMLVSWAQAQQARVAARLEVLFARDIAEAEGREEPVLALSLAAAEAAAALNLPHMTAMQLISESTRLCLEAPQTLLRLAEGRIAIQHARIILDETQNLPTEVAGTAGDSGRGADGSAAGGGARGAGEADGGPSGIGSGQLDLGLEGPGAAHSPDGPDSHAADGTGDGDSMSGRACDGTPDGGGAGRLSERGEFERDLLNAAEGRTAAGFGRRARRLRESRFPDLIPIRHRQAKDKRRVSFQALPDGMSCLSAFIAAEKGQALFAALTGAAKAGKRAGDPRTMDQLRADTLTDLFLDPGPNVTGPGAAPTGCSMPRPGTAATDALGSDQPGASIGEERPEPRDGRPGVGRSGKGPRRAERHRAHPRPRPRSRVRTEVMVLINADTLAGLNEDPAELNGYGPISPETGRRMILEALHWTPLSQDPATGEILGVGHRRRIPAGLKRWLQARDGTCRFPGCSVNVVHAEIDHTTPFAHHGPTDHANLEHLCPKHHRFKTLGHWKARQPEPGTIEWHSPTGRTYTTDPALSYMPSYPPHSPTAAPPDDDPPPF
ncbi:DUF222 domain-containing protein [Arthrobacter sp.]|uniref:HNH endonuclease signature motif containing protein n=1 Tax=Arthrobacter sp. TaxID=1667 RepID=UPI00289AAC74|nr:DUF222 domain-containing protein [Arthrobacter sp.]